jgi:DNA invertase Pin-like site-specific DNA recombinase
VAAPSVVDAEFEARMESMSKAKFEAMLAKALNRQTERRFPVSNATAADEQQDAKRCCEAERKTPLRYPIAPNEQQGTTVVKVPGKGRPRTAQEKSEQVLALAAKRMTRQAIANELGISLASVYRILKENR